MEKCQGCGENIHGDAIKCAQCRNAEANNASKFLADLRKAGIQVCMDGKDVKVSSSTGHVTDDVVKGLKEKKEAVIDLLQSESGVEASMGCGVGLTVAGIPFILLAVSLLKSPSTWATGVCLMMPAAIASVLGLWALISWRRERAKMISNGVECYTSGEWRGIAMVSVVVCVTVGYGLFALSSSRSGGKSTETYRDAGGHINSGVKLYGPNKTLYGEVANPVVKVGGEEFVQVRTPEGQTTLLKRSAIRQGNTWFIKDDDPNR